MNSLSLWQIINGEYNEKADEFNDVGLRMSAQPTDAAQKKEVTPDDAGYIVKVGDMAPDFEMS